MGNISEANRIQLPLPRHLWTVADFYRMGEVGLFAPDERIELIEGELIDMPPIGSRHANQVDILARLLMRALPDSARMRVQNPVRLSDVSEPQPDIVVARDRDYSSGHPRPEDILLLIEVADTTLEFDRKVKLPLYARHGIAEVWVLDVQKAELAIWSEPSAGEYVRHTTPRPDQSVSPGDVARSISARARAGRRAVAKPSLLEY